MSPTDRPRRAKTPPKHAKLTCYIPPELLASMQIESAERGVTLGLLIVEAFEQRSASAVVEVWRPQVLFSLGSTSVPVGNGVAHR